MSTYGALSQVGADAAQNAAAKFAELRQVIDNGNFTWKALGCAAGISLVVLSITSIPMHLLSPFNLIMDVYTCCFGALGVLLEYKDTLLPQSFTETIRREALFLYRPYGRAMFYFFVGVLVISQNALFSLSFMVGLYVAAVGAIVFVSSRGAYQAMTSLRAQGLGEGEIRTKFNQADKDKNGTLDTSELARLCSDLGTTLSRNELESALVTLDKDGDGAITYDEFVSWYYGRGGDSSL